ncbi:MAG: hypothetical protein GX886_16205, partial [Comamonadaceae bacterium]|nr:hypothetical protein [Comamonadaceae bacterium]
KTTVASNAAASESGGIESGGNESGGNESGGNESGGAVSGAMDCGRLDSSTDAERPGHAEGRRALPGPEPIDHSASVTAKSDSAASAARRRCKGRKPTMQRSLRDGRTAPLRQTAAPRRL